MSNKNYVAGRTFEYKRRDHWKSLGFHVIRASGSHGLYDLCCISPQGVELIQCKRVQTSADADRLLRKWVTNPPLLPGPYHQHLEVWVASEGEVRSATV